LAEAADAAGPAPAGSGAADNSRAAVIGTSSILMFMIDLVPFQRKMCRKGT
jgi:hypothetical protein